MEDILNGQSCAECVTCCRTCDTLMLARGAGLQGVQKLVDKNGRINRKDKQRILCRHEFWCAVVKDARRLIVPPPVAALRPRNLISSALENENVLDVGADLSIASTMALVAIVFPPR